MCNSHVCEHRSCNGVYINSYKKCIHARNLPQADLNFKNIFKRTLVYNYKLNAAWLPAQKEINPCGLHLAHNGRRKWAWLKNIRWKKKCTGLKNVNQNGFRLLPEKKDKASSFQFSKADRVFQSQQKKTVLQAQSQQLSKGESRDKQQNTRQKTTDIHDKHRHPHTHSYTPYKIIQAYMPLHPALSQWRRWPFSLTVFSAPAQPSPARYNLKPQRMLK